MAEAAASQPDDGLPIVASRGTGRTGMILAGLAILLGGALLFSVMSANRMEGGEGSTLLTEADPGARIASPPPLGLPAAWQGAEAAAPPRRLEPALPPREPPVRLVRAAPETNAGAREYLPPPPQSSFPPPPTVASRPEVVFDSLFGGREAEPILPSPGSAERVRAGRFENPSLTIPQGTVIAAVLETALDSTRPGGVRALVQRDVRGFDGSRVLIHRGSRLYGEYEADLLPGQKRANVRWTRLIRPDGVTVALDSPASDPLGRAGVRGDVDSKFFQRFGGALLQSVLDIGVGIATSRATDGVVLALPGSTQNVQVQEGGQVQPTLRVRHGTSVSVFVARDLDFSGVDG